MRLLGRALVADALLTTLADPAAGVTSSTWHALQQHVVDALRLLCADARASASIVSLALVRPLFSALAATVEMDVRCGPANAALALSGDDVCSMLRLASNLLVCDATHQPTELLRFVKAALLLLQLRDELSTEVCCSMLGVLSFLLQSNAADEGVCMQLPAADAATAVQQATLNAFAALADTPVPEQQMLLMDSLIAAAHDLPAAPGGASQWQSLGGTLLLMGVLARRLPKPTSVAVGERCLAAALAACTHISHENCAADLWQVDKATAAAVRCALAVAARARHLVDALPHHLR
jgi:hypothetical protein